MPRFPEVYHIWKTPAIFSNIVLTPHGSGMMASLVIQRCAQRFLFTDLFCTAVPWFFTHNWKWRPARLIFWVRWCDWACSQSTNSGLIDLSGGPPLFPVDSWRSSFWSSMFSVGKIVMGNGQLIGFAIFWLPWNLDLNNLKGWYFHGRSPLSYLLVFFNWIFSSTIANPPELYHIQPNFS